VTVTSTQLAGLIGPSIAALSASEAFNMPIYAAQIAPVVYLNGTILFVSGLALVRTHNYWRFDWALLITLCGWGALLLGLYRMFFPTAPQAGTGPATFAMLTALFGVGCILTWSAYWRKEE